MSKELQSIPTTALYNDRAVQCLKHGTAGRPVAEWPQTEWLHLLEQFGKESLGHKTRLDAFLTDPTHPIPDSYEGDRTKFAADITANFASMCRAVRSAPDGELHSPDRSQWHPITVIKVDESYYVVYEGHKRAAIAYHTGAPTVEAEVTDIFEPRFEATEEQLATLKGVASKREGGYQYHPSLVTQMVDHPTRRPGLWRYRTVVKALLDLTDSDYPSTSVRINDIGCNDGLFSFALAQFRNYSLHGYDPDPRAATVMAIHGELIPIDPTSRVIFHNCTCPGSYTVNATIFLDVFRHVAERQGKQAAIRLLEMIARNTTQRILFAPGPVDLIANMGISWSDMMGAIGSDWAARYLGHDNDGPSYQRHMYLLERRP